MREGTVRGGRQLRRRRRIGRAALPLATLAALTALTAWLGCGGAEPAAAPGGVRDAVTATAPAAGGANSAPGDGAPGTSLSGALTGNGALSDALPGAAREVRVARATTGLLPRTVQVSGTLAADEQVALAMKVAGRLDQMAVDLGSRVRRGDVIARLAQPDFTLRVEQAENALEQARARLGLAPESLETRVPPDSTAGVREADAQLHQARVTYERQQTLFREKLISQQDLDAAEANFRVAEARREDSLNEARNRVATLAQRQSEVGMARQALTDSTLTAPFDGAIRERRAVAGDFVAIGQPIVVLVRMHPLRLRLAVPEREAASLRVGQAVQLTVEGDSRAWTGRVARISPAISEDNRTLLIEAEVPNRDGQLRPGAFARAAIVVEEARAAGPAVLVPSAAVVTFAGLTKVIGVEAGRAREKEIKTGRRAGDRTEVLDGVRAGEVVVVNPGNLVSGQAVKIVRR